jgi:hypothetical protein
MFGNPYFRGRIDGLYPVPKGVKQSIWTNISHSKDSSDVADLSLFMQISAFIIEKLKYKMLYLVFCVITNSDFH